MLDRFFTPHMTELGKIKIGGKSSKTYATGGGGTFRPPEKHDHFTITTMQRTPAGDLVPDTDLMDALAREFGDADGLLRQLPVQVLSNDIEDVMQSAYVWYGGRSVGARSDGESVTWFVEFPSMKRLDTPKVEPWSDSMLDLFWTDKKSNKIKLFKLHTVFNCVIAAKEARFGGVYKFRTTSVISGRQLYSSMIELQARTFGVLMGLPLRLIVRPQAVTPDGKATTVYVVHVELRGPSLAEIQGQALAQMKVFADHRDQMQLVQARYKRMLLPPGSETTAGDTAEINDEFQPETAVEIVPSERVTPKDSEPDPLLAGLDEPEPTGEPQEEEHADPLAEFEQAPPPDEAPATAMIGDDQVAEIKTLCVAAKVAPKAWQGILAEYKVKSGADLTAADALDLILKLRALRDERRKRGNGKAKEQNPDTELDDLTDAIEELLAKVGLETFNKISAGLGISDDWTKADLPAMRQFRHLLMAASAQ